MPRAVPHLVRAWPTSAVTQPDDGWDAKPPCTGKSTATQICASPRLAPIALATPGFMAPAMSLASEPTNVLEV